MTIAWLPGTAIGGRIYEGMPCIVCNEKVEPGTGAPAMPPMLPALHGKCAQAAAEQLRAAKKDPP